MWWDTQADNAGTGFESQSETITHWTNMKTTISFEFELPEQELEYWSVCRAQQSMRILHALEQMLRNQIKYGDYANDREIMLECRELINEVLEF